MASWAESPAAASTNTTRAPAERPGPAERESGCSSLQLLLSSAPHASRPGGAPPHQPSHLLRDVRGRKIDGELGHRLAYLVEDGRIELVRRVLERVCVAVGEVDQVDRRHPLLEEWDVVVEHGGLGRGGEGRLGTYLIGRHAEALPELRARVLLTRNARVAVGDVVEQDHVPDLASVGRGVDAGTAQRAELEVLLVAAGWVLLAVEEDEADLAMAGRELGGQRAGELDHARGAGGAVVGADEAARLVLGVVVGADQDRGPGPRQDAHDVPEAALRAGAPDGLEVRIGEIPAQRHGEVAELLRASRTLTNRDLRADQRHRPVGVEAVGATIPVATAARAERQRREQQRRRRDAAATFPATPPAFPCA